jgi:hypothetical protein
MHTMGTKQKQLRKQTRRWVLHSLHAGMPAPAALSEVQGRSCCSTYSVAPHQLSPLRGCAATMAGKATYCSGTPTLPISTASFNEPTASFP